MPSYSWHAVDFDTGKRGPALTTRTRGTVSRIINEPTDTQIDVLVWDVAAGRPVPEWRQWTQPRKSLAVLVDENDDVVWCGRVVRRATPQDEWVTLSLSTLESYFDRVYMTSLSVTDDVAQIAKVVADKAYAFASNAVNTGVVITREFVGTQDRTLLATLGDLTTLDTPIEFTIDAQWRDATRARLRATVQIAPRIGKSLPVPTRFEHPGPVTEFELVEDYSKDNGANVVQAVGSGDDNRPSSDPLFADGAAISTLRYERRFSPSVSVTDEATLNAYAAAELARVRNGLTELSLKANLSTAPRLNSDWFLGDDITAALTSPAFPYQRNADGVLRPGYERTVRVVGWSIDLDAEVLTPTVREIT